GVVRLGANVQTPMREVKVWPLERLEFAPAKSCRERHGEERLFPEVAHAEKPLEVVLAIGDRTFAELGEFGNFLDWVIDLEPSEEVVQDHPVGVERGARVATFGFAPGQKPFDVLWRDLAGVRFGGGVFREEIQDVV